MQIASWPRRIAVLLTLWVAVSGESLPVRAVPAAPPLTAQVYPHAPADDELVALCERRAFDYFWNEADAETGLVKDRARDFGHDKYTVSSIAATGFGLAVLAVGAQRGWASRSLAYQRALTTLRCCRDKLPGEHGWFYHFVDIHTGRRVWGCEVSSIDTGFLLAGALLIGQYFSGTEVQRLADELYRRVDFPWMLSDGGAKPESRLLCHGWKPEQGFLRYRWDAYSEHMLLYLLALGSPTHPIPAACWEAWQRPQGEYAGHRTFTAGPLFEHQFSHAFVDFRGRRDRLGYDYWGSSVEATKANRQFCIDQAKQFQTYGENVWGLSACDGPDGYHAYGAPPGRVQQDGTVAPWAVAASIVFTPELCLPAMRQMRAGYGGQVWGRYGFCEAFNLDKPWFGQDVIGTDIGCALLMLENYRSGLIWRTFCGVPAVRAGLRAAGFVAPT